MSSGLELSGYSIKWPGTSSGSEASKVRVRRADPWARRLGSRGPQPRPWATSCSWKGYLNATMAPITPASTPAGEMVAANTVGPWASNSSFVVPMRTFVRLAAGRSCRAGGPPSLYQLLGAVPGSVLEAMGHKQDE